MKTLALSIACLALVSCAEPQTRPPQTVEAAPPPSVSATPAETWRSTAPPTGAAAQFEYPAPEVAQLPNGMTLMVVRRPGTIVWSGVVSRHGASSVPPGKSGLAALTARLLTEGTQRKNNLQLAEAVEALGSSLDHDAGRDYLTIGLTTLRADLNRGLSLLAEVVQTPAFRGAEFERVRAEWVDGLIAERQSPARLASLVALRALWGPVQGAPVAGGVSDVKRLTVVDVRAFHRRAVAPAQTSLLVVGDVDLAAVQAEATKSFGSYRSRGDEPPREAVAPSTPPTTHVLMVDRPESVQSAVFVAQPFPPRGAPGHEARQVLSGVLGGLFTSRINHNLREEHAYTYGARSQAIATRQWGAFTVATNVMTESTAPALKELRAELAQVRGQPAPKPVTEEELARSKADLINGLGAHLEHVERVAGDLQTLFSLGLPQTHWSDYPELVRRVSAEEVAAAAELLRPEALIVVVVGDRARIEAAVREQFGAVTTAAPSLLD